MKTKWSMAEVTLCEHGVAAPKVCSICEPYDFYEAYAMTYCAVEHIVITTSLFERLIVAWLKTDRDLSELDRRLRKANHA